MKNNYDILELRVAQATRLFRLATRRTEGKRCGLTKEVFYQQRRLSPFRSAGRQPERAGRPRHPFLVALTFWFLGSIFGAASLFGGVVKIELPPETGTYKAAPGYEMANAQCLTCHSVEYVQTQPPKPLEFWTAEVKKMRDKYGAQYPEQYNDGLAYYLARNYGTETNNRAVVFPEIDSPAGGSQPLTAEGLAKKYGCSSCHNANVKVVGPAFRDVSAKYRNDPAALDKIAQQIHHGGSGKWGSALMPPYPNTIVSDGQAQMLGKWIMSQTGGNAPTGKPANNGQQPGSDFQ